MKNSLTRTLCTVVFVASAASAWAQYPTIPAVSYTHLTLPTICSV